MKSRGDLKTWREWVLAYKGDVLQLREDSLRFKDARRMLESNSSVPERGIVLRWLARMYVPAMSAGIRRQVDGTRGTLSLFRLLSSISRNPRALTRSAWIEAYKPADARERRLLEREFDRYYSAGRDFIDKEMVEEDLLELVKAAEWVKAHADNHVAHLNSARALGRARFLPLSLGQLDRALDAVFMLQNKYSLLVTGHSLSEEKPMPQGDWTAAFAVPWRPPPG